MFESSAQILKVSVLTAILVIFSTNTCAEIYKWRDARGITKYSDIPPPFAFTKATRGEVINALQAKEVCVLPNAKTATTGAIPTKLASAATTNNGAQMNFAFNKVGAPSTPVSNKNALPAQSTANSSNDSALRSFFGKFTATRPAVPVATKPVITVKPIAIKPAPVTATAPVVNTTPKQTVAQAAPVAAIPVAAAPVAPTTPAVPADTATPANIVQVALMPAVDISKNVSPATGYSELRIQPTTLLPGVGDNGAFRVICKVSHMSNDDPLVYPNQPGAAHHHTFFGNTSTNAKSNLINMANTGNSTCDGGIANRSAYWIPSVINTSTNTPVIPDTAMFYYKTGGEIPTLLINAPPKGLRMIAGNSKATDDTTSTGMYYCNPPDGVNRPWTGWKKSIPNCAAGDMLVGRVDFPQCWDGVNLDSPNHKDHMANVDGRLTTPNKCPATHPIAIPAITENFFYKITSTSQIAKWRLASDNYANTSPGGYSAHADWVNGWDEKVMAGIVKNCLQKNLDCHGDLLGDGRTFY